MIFNIISWEDPLIEQEIVQELYNKNNDPLSILMMGTAGDTILNIISDPKIKLITCLSSSMRQLAVIEIKGYLLETIDHPETRLAFLEGRLPKVQIAQYYNTFCQRLQSKKYWDLNISSLFND